MSNFEAIQKWFYFTQNYKVGYYRWENMWGEYRSGTYPCFLMEIDWKCNRDHIIDKWSRIESQSSWGDRINKFFAGLDKFSRQRLVDYAMKE